MDNTHIKNITNDESLLGYATATFVPMAKSVVKHNHAETRQDMTGTEVNGKVNPVKRQQVYLHSIGRFSKLRKLQMGTFGD